VSEPNKTNDGWADSNLYNENFSKIPYEEIAKYAGRYIAVTPDGSRILMAGDYYDDVDDKLIAAGIDPSQVVHDYIPPEGVSLV
jgi:hypothetical protein